MPTPEARRARWAALLVLVLGAFASLTACSDADTGGRSSTTTAITGAASTTAPPTTAPSSTASTTPSTTASTGVSTTTAPPTPAGPATLIWRGATDRAQVAFSFDAGSDVGSTERILRILARHDLVVSFGITGDWARAHPDLLRSISTAGHHIINHTDNHRSFTGVSTSTPPLSTAERHAEITGGDTAIARVVGHTTAPWFRPPYGDTDTTVQADAGAVGFTSEVMWTVDSLGWKGNDPAVVAARCLAGAGNGVIYLFHVGAASTDADALETIIRGLRDRGYSIGSVPSVL